MRPQITIWQVENGYRVMRKKAYEHSQYVFKTFDEVVMFLRGTFKPEFYEDKVPTGEGE